MAPSLSITLLGRFGVDVDGRAIPDAAWKLRKAKHMLKLLALDPSHRIHRERALETLWPDREPAAAAGDLRYALHAIRRVLEPDRSGAPGLVRLRHDHVGFDEGVTLVVDLESFRVAATDALARSDPAASERALELYGGDLLPDDIYEDWAAMPREQARELRLALLRHLADRYASRGDNAAAIGAYERLLASEPTDEPGHAVLIRLYAERGDRAGALRRYEVLARTLRAELGLDPQPATRRLRDDIAAGRIGPPVPSPRGWIPAQLTSLVGREREIAEVTRALGSSRLVTLTGPAGCGKTRLAVAVGERIQASAADGVWFVDLGPVDADGAVAETVMRAMRLQLSGGTPELAAWLGDRELLLVLDGCEHLRSAAASFASAVLADCPRVRILATSLVTLGVIGEHVFDVPPLGLPPGDAAPDAIVASAAPALRLFIERARMVRGGFALTDANARAVADICRRVDGLPLALELAAARTRALSLDEIASRIAAAYDDPGMRGRSIRQAIAWSYEQLDEASRALLERLAVFRRWWSLEAAEVVASDDPIARRSVADVLRLLVERSLVTTELSENGTVRYRMLDSVRAFATERLRASGQERSAAGRHARYFRARAEAAAPELDSARQVEVLDRFAADHEELHAALRWYVAEGDADEALRFVRALAPFWTMRGHYEEGLHLAFEALALDAGREPTVLRAEVALAAGSLAAGRAMNAEARAHFADARAIFDRLADRRGLAAVLQELGMLAVVEGRPSEARSLQEAALAMLKEVGDVAGVARSQFGLANVARYEEAWPTAREMAEASRATSRSLGDLHGELAATALLATIDHMERDMSAARSGYEEAIRLARVTGDRVWEARLSSNLGLLRLEQGAAAEARQLLAEALGVLRQGYGHALTLALEDVASLAAARGSFERACRLGGAAEASRRAIGEVATPVREAALDAWLPVARSTLGARADAAWEDGLRRRLSWAVAEAERVLADPAETTVRWPPFAPSAAPVSG